jgi:hypothetical protein
MKTRILRATAVFVALNIFIESMIPLAAFALTTGPSQPEVQSFEPAETSQMVDLFTGDFNYNLPLLEVPGPNGGYPLNLAYHSGITMDQEASWVGLGWNINVGVINRQMRGLPDDFNGDPIVREVDMKTNITFGIGMGGGIEFCGKDFTAVSYGSASIGLTMRYNNYRGLGYSIDPSLAVHSGSTNKNTATCGLGFNFTFDSQDGVGFNHSISMSAKHGDNNYSFSVGIGYNSRKGLQSSHFSSTIYKKECKDFIKVDETGNVISTGSASVGYAIGGTSKYSFFDGSYTPTSSIPFTGTNISVQFKYGFASVLLHPNEFSSGFFSSQWVNKNTITNNGYGYLYSQNAILDEGALMDFSREKDGVIRKQNPYIPIPQMNFDVYSCVGQGMACMYRPFRSDIGVLKDPTSKSTTTGGGIGGEYGVGVIGSEYHWGADASINSSIDESFNPLDPTISSDPTKRIIPDETFNQLTNKTSTNDNSGKYAFSGKTNGSLFEPYYYKTNGEITVESSNELNKIGGYKPQRVDISDSYNGFGTDIIKNVLLDDDGNPHNIAPSDSKRDTRKPRNQVVNTLTNDDLLGANGNEVLNDYKIKYSNTSGDILNYDRTAKKSNHIGVISSLGADGKKYIYALPAYNKKHVECNFTVSEQATKGSGEVIDYDINNLDKKPNITNPDIPDYNKGTEDYISRTSTPDYAHAYLLTSVLGTDYVDIDGTPGPSDGDLGYWVKFNYVKVYDNYKWRAPYQGATFSRGSNFRPEDDKASYLYGEKEIWHLASVETKSHIAIFEISKRNDAIEAIGEYASTNPSAKGINSLYKLDRIKLFAKQDYISNKSSAIPIKNSGVFL